MPHHSFYSLIGKPVIEKYGRFKGRVIAFELDEEGSLKNIVFENGGVILYKNINSFEINDEYLVFLPALVKEGKYYIKEFKNMVLYLETLKKIFNIEPDNTFIYEYYKKISLKYTKLSDRVNFFLKKIERRKQSIEKEINRLKKIIFTLNIGRENEFIDQSIYQFIYDFLSNEILKYTSELEDIEHLEVDVSSISSKINGLLNELKEVLKVEEEKIEYS